MQYGLRGRRGLFYAHGVTLALAAALTATAAGAADTLVVALDQARIAKLPDRVVTVIVGNPLIADAIVQPGGLMVVTGKGYGVTNIIALDRSGSVLTEKNVAVEGPRGNIVVLYKGVERETYSCESQCIRRNTLGDSQPYFDSTMAQSSTRNKETLTAAAGR
jgi:Flp pilus assembly secretin CpaC